MSYDNNSLLRAVGEQVEYTPEMIEEYIRCQEDILYFTNKYFTIINVDEGEQVINLRDYQKRILKAFQDKRKKNKIVLMPRQQGKTTTVGAFILHHILFNDTRYVAILANKEAQSKEILDRIKFAYERLPYWLQQGVKEWNKKGIALENDSQIMIGTTSSSAVRGKSISLLYLDEFAHIPQHIAKEFLDSVFPTIESAKSSQVIITSTPKGLNHFHNIWQGAIREQNNYLPLRVKWEELPERNEQWKKGIIANHGLQHFLQEYECEFLGASNTLLRTETLEKLGYKEPQILKLDGTFGIFELPIQNKFYVLGIDCAEGVGRNYSVIQVLRIDNDKSIHQVAIYRNNLISPYSFAQVCIEISKLYNNAPMMIENNGIGSELCNYIWYDFECDHIINFDGKGLGIRSSHKSKLAACLFMKRYIEHKYLKIIEKNTTNELFRFVEKREGVFQAANDEDTDDCVMALVWGLWYVSTDFFDGQRIENIEERINLESLYDEKKTDEQNDEDDVSGIMLDENDIEDKPKWTDPFGDEHDLDGGNIIV